MKRPTEQLLDDLLEDAASPVFRAALMDKTLHSARQRKRGRRFNLALGATALVGILAIALQEIREPMIAPDQIRQPTLSAANIHESSPVQIVSTKLDSASALTMVQTTEAARPKEINDKQLLALLSEKPVALVHQGAHQAELIFLNSEDEKGFPVQ